MQQEPIDLLAIRDRTFVRNISFHEQLASTNTRALEMAVDPRLALPTLVLAEQQSAGRGRGANRWWSAPGALTFSVILELSDMELSAISRVSLAVGLGLCEACEQWLPRSDVGLKWPNDILLGGRKLCGILIERPAANSTRTVIGVGINVNNSMRGAPTEIRDAATALIDHASAPLDRTDVLSVCLNAVERRVEMLRGSSEVLAKDWGQFCCLTGRRVSVSVSGEVTVGICRGIDAAGSLLLDAGQTRHQFVAGTVRILDESG